MNLMYSFSDAGAAHCKITYAKSVMQGLLTAKSPMQNQPLHFTRISDIKIGSF